MSRGGQQQAAETVVRHCVHRQHGAEVAEYGGTQFVAALQRLRAGRGLTVARKVEPFFWEDAWKVRVWLCAECARELGL